MSKAAALAIHRAARTEWRAPPHMKAERSKRASVCGHPHLPSPSAGRGDDSCRAPLASLNISSWQSATTIFPASNQPLKKSNQSAAVTLCL